MIQINFGYGVGRDRNDNPISLRSLGIAEESIKRTAVQLFGGYTLYQTEGGWTDPRGMLVEEQGRTLMVFVYAIDKHKVEILRHSIQVELNQEEVIVTQTEVTQLAREGPLK